MPARDSPGDRWEPRAFAEIDGVIRGVCREGGGPNKVS